MREWQADETLGDRIRTGRARKRLTLRQAADAVKRSPSFLSDVENGRRAPSEDVLVDLAALLDLDLDDLMAVAGKLPTDVSEYLRNTPEAGRLFRTLSSRRVDSDGVRKLIEQAGSLGTAEADAADLER
jgi:transcriptional regulator with XRE-family HTH domain